MRGRGIEKRVERRTQRPLIEQLDDGACGYTPGLSSGGARGGKPGSKPPATLDMLNLLHTVDDMLDAYGASGKTRAARLRNLVTLSRTESEEWEQYVCMHLNRHIKTARIMLCYDMPKRALRDVVCGACGSTLVVAVDASSDVSCVDHDCGKVYTQYEWVDLLTHDE